MSKRLATIRHVWAVVRVDTFIPPSKSAADLAEQVFVKEVVPDEATARTEVARLNKLNGDKGAFYFAQITRLRDLETSVIPPSF